MATSGQKEIKTSYRERPYTDKVLKAEIGSNVPSRYKAGL